MAEVKILIQGFTSAFRPILLLPVAAQCLKLESNNSYEK
jgi:hypothetical protein